MLIIELIVFDLIGVVSIFVILFDPAKIRYSIEMPNQSLKTFSSFFKKKSTAIVNNLDKQLKMIKLLFFHCLPKPFLIYISSISKNNQGKMSFFFPIFGASNKKGQL